MTDMDMNEMMAAIDQVCQRELPPSDPGASVSELAAHWGVGVGRARTRIKLALENGKLLIGKRWRIDAAGRCVSEQVYRPA